MKILAELAIAVAAVILIVTLACLLVEPAHAALEHYPAPGTTCMGTMWLVGVLLVDAWVAAAIAFIAAALFASGGTDDRRPHRRRRFARRIATAE
jgi:hypothetical protein